MAADDILAREYLYLKESSFHSDGLRDRFLQLYLVLAGTALSGAVALADKDRVLLPEVLAGLTAGLALVGLMVLLMLVRLRRVAVECMQGMTLIKLCLTRPLSANQRERVEGAIPWGQETVPRAPTWRADLLKVHFLSAGIVALLTALLAGAAAFYLQLAFLADPAGEQATDIHPFLYRAALVSLLTLALLVELYQRRLRAEMRQPEEAFRERCALLAPPMPGPSETPGLGAGDAGGGSGSARPAKEAP